MPIKLRINEDGIRVLERISFHLADLGEDSRRVARQKLSNLGIRIESAFRSRLRPHRYQGTLEGSVKSNVDESGNTLTLEAGPTAKRGQYDAGALLELGTPPNPHVPWGAINAWGSARGIDSPGAVWNAIRTKGIKPHPFVESTFSDVKDDIEKTAGEIGEGTARAVIDLSE